MESMKQCVEPESTRVVMIIFGAKVEISWSVKEFGLERADALRRSSAIAPTRSTQPWSGAGAQGLLPIFWLLGRGAVVRSFLADAARALAAVEVAFRHSLAI